MDLQQRRQMCLSIFCILSLSSFSAWSQCSQRGTVIICRGKVPTLEDLEGRQASGLIVSTLSEGSWLTLPDKDFEGLGLQKFDLQQSDVTRIDRGYFALISGNNKLKKLSFRNVRGPISVDRGMLMGLERSLSHLKIESNITVDLAALTDMVGLTELQIYRANIIGTPDEFEKILSRLRSLEIKDTNLRHLPWEAISKWVTEDSSRSLKINGNKWNCDCSIVALKRLQPSIVQTDLQMLSCDSPSTMFGRRLFAIADDELCPKETSHTVQTGHGNGEGNPPTGHVGSSGGNSADIAPSGGGETGYIGEETRAAGVRIEVIIAGTVVGAIVLAFIIFLIVYKCRPCKDGQTKDERATRTHKNTRYVSVIESPAPSQHPNENGLTTSADYHKYAGGSSV